MLFVFNFSAAAYDNVTSSCDLMYRAAECLKKKDYKGVKYYTQKCISLYKAQALQMSRKLKDFAPFETANLYWALNDVAYAYYLQGEMYRELGKYELARRKYEMVLKKFKYAQVYDPAIGGDWKVAEECKKKLELIKGKLNKSKNNKFIKKELRPLKIQ